MQRRYDIVLDIYQEKNYSNLFFGQGDRGNIIAVSFEERGNPLSLDGKISLVKMNDEYKLDTSMEDDTLFIDLPVSAVSKMGKNSLTVALMDGEHLLTVQKVSYVVKEGIGNLDDIPPAPGEESLMAQVLDELTEARKDITVLKTDKADKTEVYTIPETDEMLSGKVTTADGKTASGSLTTNEKTNLVSAINEVKQTADGIAGVSSILSAHTANSDIHVTASNKDYWNRKADGIHTHLKQDVGLGNADNTADLNKPVSKAAQAALDKKADKSDLPDIRSGENIFIERSGRTLTINAEQCDLTEYYTRAETNGLLAPKADRSELPEIIAGANVTVTKNDGNVVISAAEGIGGEADLSNYYTKPEVDQKVNRVHVAPNGPLPDMKNGDVWFIAEEDKPFAKAGYQNISLSDEAPEDGQNWGDTRQTAMSSVKFIDGKLVVAKEPSHDTRFFGDTEPERRE